jgi:uncharacterized membrane protein
MTRSLKPFTTTLIGGVVFLLPLIVVLYVLGQGLALAARAVQPVVALLPFQNVGGIALAGLAALALVLLLCFGAGLLARAAVGRSFSERFENRLQTLYPRYSVVKAMSQGLHGALGRQVLKPVLASFDDHQLIAFDVERLDDGRAVLYLPGAPDAWSGRVVLVAAERLRPLDIDPAELAKALQGLGQGTAALLRAAGRADDRSAPRRRLDEG